MPNKPRNQRIPASRGSSRLDRRLLPGPGLPSTGAQKVVKETLAGSSVLLSTQATTGLFTTSALSPSLSAIANAAKRTYYDEYRITGVDFFIRACSGSNGVSQFLVDDEDATGGNASYFEARPDRHVLVNNSASQLSAVDIRWRAQDLEDLEWRSTDNDYSFNPCTLKFYTSLTEYGTPASVTGAFHVFYLVHLEWRGVGKNR